MTTLNLAAFKAVWVDDFTKEIRFDNSIWPIVWGHANDFSWNVNGLTVTSYQSEGWANAGFIQPDGGASQSQGYGLYSATAWVPNHQGIGICIVMWPADNVWPGPEIDLVENWSDPTNQTAYMTIHWKGVGNSNGQDSHQFAVNLEVPHTFAADWEQGLLTYYVDGKEVFHVTGAEVPKDAADGGVNEAFGAEVTAANTGPQPTDRVSLTISSMSYSVPIAGGAVPTIDVSDPGAVQEATVGAGVDVTERVTATGLSTVFEAVFTAAGVREGNWQTVTLDSNGAGSAAMHFAHTGDFAVATDNTTTQAVKGLSAAIIITDQGVGPGITLSSPGTAQEASAGAGVTLVETVSAPGLATIFEMVFTSANVGETGWNAVALDSKGGATFSAHFQHTGDYVVVVGNTTQQTVRALSTPITITGGTVVTPSISVSAPGTVQEASVGAGVNVAETFTAKGMSTVYEAVFTSANVAEANWLAVSLNASGVGSSTMHFQHSGDYIVAVNSPTLQTVKGWSTPITITDPVKTVVKTWNGATAAITAADWTPAGMPTAGQLGVISVGAVLADHMTLDGFSLLLAGNGTGVAPTLELNGTTLGPKFQINAVFAASNGVVPTDRLSANGANNNAGQIVVGSMTAPASLTILLGSRTAALANTGTMQANPGSDIHFTAGQIVNNGKMVANGGSLLIDSQMTGTGTMMIERGGGHAGSVTADLIVGSGQTMLMHGGVLALASPNNFLGTLQDWDSGTVLDLLHTHMTSLDLAGGLLIAHDGAFIDAQLHLSGTYSSSDFHFTNQADGTALITTTHTGAFS
jgi:hypothetical protein